MVKVKFHQVICEVCKGKGYLRERTGHQRECPECGGGGHFMESEAAINARRGLVRMLRPEVSE